MRHELLTLAIVVVGIFICVKGVMVEQMIERLPEWARGRLTSPPPSSGWPVSSLSCRRWA